MSTEQKYTAESVATLYRTGGYVFVNPTKAGADMPEGEYELYLARPADMREPVTDEDVRAFAEQYHGHPDAGHHDDIRAALEAFAARRAAPVVVADWTVLDWAISRWMAEVSERPLTNKHRRSLDDAWRQVIRRCGGDDVVLCGPRHDDLAAAPKPEDK